MRFTITQIVVLAAMCAMPLYCQVRLTPVVAEGLVVEKSDPVYPPLAKQTKLQGTVKVDVTVSESGAVASTKVISGNPLLVAAALDAVRKRKYMPYMVDGKRTSFVTTVEIAFSAGIAKEEYDRQQAVNDKYFKLEDRCRALLNGSKSKEAEQSCREAVPVADKLGDPQGLTKMGAYEHVG